MKRIGVLCSGGDAPGMNPNVRAVVRAGIEAGLEVWGIERGYSGLIKGALAPLGSHDVSGLINRGGTILRTARCAEFMHAEGRAQAAATLRARGIDGLVVCGGDGSFTGAQLIYREHGIPIAGTPGTIDDDLCGTDHTIGFHTAVTTAVEACDKIRDTADDHDRIFVVEVMGRRCGAIALETALAAGAEVVLLPERPGLGPRECAQRLRHAREQGKTSMLVIVAEGAGKGEAVTKVIADALPDAEVRCSVLGYMLRGGVPTVNDRILATVTGVDAVHALLERGAGCCHHIGVIANRVVRTPLSEVVGRPKIIEADLVALVDVTAGLRPWQSG